MDSHLPLPKGAGRSSFDLIAAEAFFSKIKLQPGCIMLDLGCGEGRYTLPLARRLGPRGRVYALDLWEEGLTALAARARQEGVNNLQLLKADAGQPWPLADACLDLILMATVLHDLAETGAARGALTEAARCLKPGGTLVLVEFKKIPGPPGPPLEIRLGPEDAAALVRPFGFKPEDPAELGPFLYLLNCRKKEA